MLFHKDGSLPVNDEIFVFGSNLAGVHGAGAALEAKKQYGAKQGQGRGLWGKSYAIPSKDLKIKTLPINEIRGYVGDFISFAKVATNLKFFLTSIGCGLAGYTPADIAPLFRDAPANCNFPETWEQYLKDIQ